MSEAASIGPAASAVHSGQQLAAARQSCNLSVADVAHQLKLSPAQVQAMEAGEYQRLPGPVFVRGFIRNYARLVKLDPKLLVAEAEQRIAPQPKAAVQMQPSRDIPFPSGRELKWHKYAIGALLVVAALVMFEFYGSTTDAPSEVTVKSRVLPLPEAQIIEKPAAGAMPTQVAAAVEAEPQSTAGQAPASGAKSAAVSAAAALTPAHAERKGGEHLLRLNFDKESWVEIRDRSGRKIFSQLNPAGSAQMVSGVPPLTLVVGNAAGVRLTYDDRPVNLVPHINVDVARLTLE